MNDFDDLVGRAVTGRADAAPTDRPAFGDVLSRRQDRLRRRTMLATVVIVAVGVSGMAALAVRDDAPSASDSIDVAGDSPLPASPGSEFGDMNGDADGGVWFCRGRLEPSELSPAGHETYPTTTVSPPTPTTAPVQESVVGQDDAVLYDEMPLEDSGYFRDCRQIEAPGPSVDAPPEPETTIAIAVPTTVDGNVPASCSAESGSYTVQSGDYPVLIADEFGVSIDDLLAVNGWSTAGEFPFPGVEMMIPPVDCSPPPASSIPAEASSTTTSTTPASD